MISLFHMGMNFSKEFSVTEKVYTNFVNTFGDRNPLHTDEKFATEKGFSGRVMHGNILNGFISYFVGECLPIKDVIIHSQEIQFKNPVYLEDELQFDATVTDVFESVNAVEFKFTFKNKSLKVVSKGRIQIGVFS